MGVVFAVDAVAQVMHVASNAGQFDEVVVIAELLQDFSGRHGHFRRVLARMVRVAKSAEDLIALFQVDIEFLAWAIFSYVNFFIFSHSFIFCTGLFSITKEGMISVKNR